ncbi:MAG: hypothetical protein SGPRY_012272 [Prymnesium sp.]
MQALQPCLGGALSCLHKLALRTPPPPPPRRKCDSPSTLSAHGLPSSPLLLRLSDVPVAPPNSLRFSHSSYVRKSDVPDPPSRRSYFSVPEEDEELLQALSHRCVLLVTSLQGSSPMCYLHSRKSRQLLSAKNVSFLEIDGAQPEYRELREMLWNLAGERTYPLIFLDKALLGGFDILEQASHYSHFPIHTHPLTSLAVPCKLSILLLAHLLTSSPLRLHVPSPPAYLSPSHPTAHSTPLAISPLPHFSSLTCPSTYHHQHIFSLLSPSMSLSLITSLTFHLLTTLPPRPIWSLLHHASHLSPSSPLHVNPSTTTSPPNLFLPPRPCPALQLIECNEDDGRFDFVFGPWRIPNEAASRIQAASRAMIDRRQIAEYHEAATALQAITRGRIERRTIRLSQLSLVSHQQDEELPPGRRTAGMCETVDLSSPPMRKRFPSMPRLHHARINPLNQTPRMTPNAVTSTRTSDNHVRATGAPEA